MPRGDPRNLNQSSRQQILTLDPPDRMGDGQTPRNPPFPGFGPHLVDHDGQHYEQQHQQEKDGCVGGIVTTVANNELRNGQSSQPAKESRDEDRSPRPLARTEQPTGDPGDNEGHRNERRDNIEIAENR